MLSPLFPIVLLPSLSTCPRVCEAVRRRKCRKGCLCACATNCKHRSLLTLSAIDREAQKLYLREYETKEDEYLRLERYEANTCYSFLFLHADVERFIANLIPTGNTTSFARASTSNGMIPTSTSSCR